MIEPNFTYFLVHYLFKKVFKKNSNKHKENMDIRYSSVGSFSDFIYKDRNSHKESLIGNQYNGDNNSDENYNRV